MGANPFVSEPPAVRADAWFTTRRLTGSSTPIWRMCSSSFECSAAECPAPSTSRLAFARATASSKVSIGEDRHHRAELLLGENVLCPGPVGPHEDDPHLFGNIDARFRRDLARRFAHHVLVQVTVREDNLTQLLHLIRVRRVPDLPGREERLDRVLVKLVRREHELLMRADDAVVERRAGDDLLGGVLQVHIAVDDHRNVPGADAVGRLARGVGRLHHRPAACRDHDVGGLHERLRGLDGPVRDHLDEVFRERRAASGSPDRTVVRSRVAASAFGCGAKMTAFPAFRANIALHMGVTMGLVTGQTAATTPMGLATKIRPASSSSPMMPRDFLPLRLFQITRALPFALATLSS